MDLKDSHCMVAYTCTSWEAFIITVNECHLLYVMKKSNVNALYMSNAYGPNMNVNMGLGGTSKSKIDLQVNLIRCAML